MAALQPTFTVLHTLSTSRAPSPIVGLAWHASSSKQKSDMLATQSADGDLRVWSIGKPPTSDIPKVIRVLKRGDNVDTGLTWIAWSKNGRILQFSQGFVPLFGIRMTSWANRGPGTAKRGHGMSARSTLHTNPFRRWRA